MPAIITHDTFGQDLYKEMYGFIGGSRDEYEAFLIGNQGPDPLFYSVLVPRLRKFIHLGSIMHDEKPNETLLAFKSSLSVLDEREKAVGRAYLLGFACHYVLDSNMHPLVYFHQFQLCDAGIENFDRSDEHEVHAAIESEFDEMVLFTKRGKTIADFSPSSEVLRGSDFVLETISKMYQYVALVVFGITLPENMFKSCLKSFRRTEALFCSRSGLKRELIGRVEEIFRPYSFYRSMSPRAIEITESLFDNHEHTAWANPFTNIVSRESFWDIYHNALSSAHTSLELIDKDGFDTEVAVSITHNLNFSGEPTIALLTVEDSE